MQSLSPKTSHRDENWRLDLANGFARIDELLNYLRLSSPLPDFEFAENAEFPLRVTRSYAARIEKGNPKDPLLLQVLPSNQEYEIVSGYTDDPVGDLQSGKTPGLLHKYYGRVLIVMTGACAIHCRYCFRRNYPYTESTFSRQTEQLALDYIHADNSISEVILSGGDPLVLGNQRLSKFIGNLSRIKHVRRLRIHSRLPIVLPSRIDTSLIDGLTSNSLQPVMVLHCNHANELDKDVRHAVARLKTAGIAVFNQAVLLRGINDSLKAQINLNETLFESAIIPYYLHLLDNAKGTAHFHVDIEHARKLYQSLRERLPGYLVPRLVYEKAGAAYKLFA